jgi:hypothetical protein
MVLRTRKALRERRLSLDNSIGRIYRSPSSASENSAASRPGLFGAVPPRTQPFRHV